MSDLPITSTLDAWTPNDLRRGGFDADGVATPALRAAAGKPQLTPSPGLAAWLAETGGSLAFSTYQTGRLFFLGSKPDNSLYALERQIGSAMGLAVDSKTLWVGGRDRIWRFSNTGADQIRGQHYDAIYMPRKSYLVAQSNTHDVIADVRFQGKHYDLLYANTQFSCVAAPDEHYSFRPVWVPDFISVLAPEDRCHLNGICARDGELAYVTVCGRSDAPLGWKAGKSRGGLVIDVRSGVTVCEGLSMPHSPRWHAGKLWLIDSGGAQLGYVDFASRSFVPVIMCQGFARGIAFVGEFAVVSLARLRPKSNGLIG
ncbi:MAG: TIGR03032 family protein, partial [Herminiimonas sp.]|nr:TIGR03032 family protein [Herminiimonas sp.]